MLCVETETKRLLPKPAMLVLPADTPEHGAELVTTFIDIARWSKLVVEGLQICIALEGLLTLWL